MSAWIVSKKHIDLLVTAAMSDTFTGKDVVPNALGLMLWKENHRSVNARYSEQNDAPVYSFTRFPGKIDPVMVLKQLECYKYQSCEHDGWKTSEAFKVCRALESTMINALPGYDSAPWGIS